ncbi:uncharacterized protein LOC126967314 [Leptidea sinapis]|uniref:uncharacterized protein LOC126967314 n=1 Tax=Leptidea sinapis TaxID=189913 RepID=UPI0021C42F05|nr:uncharacterized protein LOC126967314 [Leptidea sinapis]
MPIVKTRTFCLREGIDKFYSGSHFVTVVTYYPLYDDESLIANITRTTTPVILCIMMISMITTVDGLTTVNLIILKCKLITLRHYFENLRDEVERICVRGDIEQAAEKLSNRLIEGIIMHKVLLRIFKQIDKAFRSVMALQLFQSSGSAVSLLLQIAVTLLFLLGLFLCNAGEITYQASLLSESIFYCGWNLIPSHLPRGGHLRKFVLFACIRARQPLIMKSFKMIDLTHVTFLIVNHRLGI